jgi:choline dehydrogenase-like flavoprotein
VGAGGARGTLRLRSADPTAAPKIDPNLLGDPRVIDARVFREGCAGAAAASVGAVSCRARSDGSAA